MARYGRAHLSDLGAAMEGLPTLVPVGPLIGASALAATDTGENSLPPRYLASHWLSGPLMPGAIC
jgi:hypothetical protein